jgi:tetratricopeptide (TPR) repeat protein
MAQNPPSSSGSNDAGVLEQSLEVAMAALRNSPAQFSIWERAERLSITLSRTDEVAALYRELVGNDLPADAAQSLAMRAARFHIEWLGEDAAAQIAVLQRVLALDPASEWAFERLTSVLTLAGRWDDLLGLYDRALAAVSDRDRRMAILDEAAGVAKDFAGQVARAIRYLQQLVPLRSGDEQLAASLERLLEREGRWQDLVDLWRERLALLGNEAPAGLKLQIAECLLDRLSRPDAALAETQELLDEQPGDRGGRQLLERMLAAADTPAKVREGTLERLRALYEDAELPGEVIRVLKTALPFVEPSRQISLHRELAERQIALGREVLAIDHYAAILAIDPTLTEDHRDLRHLSERTGESGAYAEALIAAAAAAADGDRRVALLIEAADLRRDLLGDEAGASELYAAVLAHPGVADAAALRVAHDLAKLLGKLGRQDQRQGVLERLTALEPDRVLATALLGEAAHLAEQLGDPGRALDLWQRRLDADADDREALDASVRLLAAMERWQPLVAALRRRADAKVEPHQRRADLIKIAELTAGPLGDSAAAITLWIEIQREFGETDEGVESLAGLLSAVDRWSELAELLGRISGQETDRVAELSSRLGDLYRGPLGQPDAAVACYRSALTVDPAHAGARAGLTELLGDPRSRSGAVQLLADLYRRRGELAELAELAEARLAVTDDPLAKAAILRESAALRERHLHDQDGAAQLLRRAFALDPAEPAIEAELRRLVAAGERWQLAADAYREAIAALPADNSARLVALRAADAELRERRLADHSGAFDSYRAVIAAQPDHRAAAFGVVRTGAALGRWDAAIADATSHMAAVGGVDEELIALIESSAAEHGAWEPVITETERATATIFAAAPELAAELDGRLGLWHRDHRGDAAAAIRALQRSLAQHPDHVARLEALAELQRHAPSAALIDTLVTLSSLRHRDLDELYEASDRAVELLGDAPRTRELLVSLRDRASAVHNRGLAAGGARTVSESLERAITALAELHERAGERAAAIDLLARGAFLAVSPERSLEMRRRAAALCVEHGDAGRAIELYRGLMEQAPDDLETVRRLADLYQRDERYPELLVLRRHELQRTEDPARRLDLRLDISRIVGVLEERGGRVEVLVKNLDEEPAHDPSLDALTRVLEGKGAFGQLTEFLSRHAERLEKIPDPGRAARIWAQVAGLAEARLSDVRRAIDAHGHVVALTPSVTALDALSRLHLGLGEPALAVPWLARRLDLTAGTVERTAQVLQLATAQVSAAQVDGAITALAAACAADPAEPRTRDMLADLYRTVGAWQELASLLLRASDHVFDPAQALAFLREAAVIFTDRIGELDQAIPVFERLTRLDPENREVRLLLADSLLSADRRDEAQKILEALVAAYGRRRSPERAGVHFRLAKIYRAKGQVADALVALDDAANMDPGHLGILRMFADLSYESGDSQRAERAYRALLLAIRRHPGDDAAVGVAEVQYELSRLAASRGQEVQARELYESAYITALQNDVDARKLQRALKAHGDDAQLARLLEHRLTSAEDPSSRAEILGELGAVREREGKPQEAFELRLRALQDAPGSAALHQAARDQAVRSGQTPRYAELLRGLTDKQRRQGDAALAADLWLRLAEIAEGELGDREEAEGAFSKAEATGERLVEAWIGLARLAAIKGDRARQAELFEKISSLPADGMTPENRAQAAYGLAELRLADVDTREAGVRALRRAVDEDRRYELAEPILRRALASAPDHPDLLGLYEHILRQLGDDALLLSFIERSALADGASAALAHEATELALRHGDQERVERLLTRTIELARERPVDDHHQSWALLILARRRRDAGDLQGAVSYLRDATPIADAAELFELGSSLAEMATLQGDPRLAAELYEELLVQDRANRRLWEPLMQLYRQLDEHRRLQRLVEDTLGYLTEPSERNTLRMELARSLAGRLGGETDAVRLLRDVLMEAPENREAEAMLAEIFERTGYDAELSQLLNQQFLAAQERGDIDMMVSVALRLGELLRASHLDEALAIYRRALAAAPDHRPLIEALLALFDADHDPRERVQLKERLAALETGEEAVALAFEVARAWEEQGDQEAALRVLERAYHAEPWSAELRSELEGRYRGAEAWAKLAELIAFAAEREASPERGAAAFREVAALYSERLGDSARAIGALRAASGRSPNDLGLLRELVSRLADAGDHKAAIHELNHVIDWQPMSDDVMLELLKTRAEYRTLIEDEAGAVGDLELAYKLVGAALVPELIAALESLRGSAARRGDLGAERLATLRLVDILGAEGGAEQARMTLAAWVERSPDDVEALGRLLDIDSAAERWDAVIESCDRMIDAVGGAAQVQAALRLVDACARAERPEEAKAGLEKVYALNPDNAELRGHLKKIYEDAEDYSKMAQILIAEAKAVEDEDKRFLMLRQAGELLLDEDGEAAAKALKQAIELRPTDQAVNLLLVEAYTAASNFKAADEILEAAIEAMRGRRSPELCVLQYRKAKVANAMGDAENELKWLKEAYHSDRNNGDVAVELAELAEKMEDWDLAIRVLRSIALMEAAPISRAVAYLRQGYIAERRGDRQKAVLWGRKALMEDPNCQEATVFLQQIGEL